MNKQNKRVTLCGSSKYWIAFDIINRKLSLEGYTVYSLAIFPHKDGESLSKEEKEILDQVHLDKIDNSDSIFVIDIDGYWGESTRREIAYAEKQGKVIKYLSSFPDLKYIVDNELMSYNIEVKRPPVHHRWKNPFQKNQDSNDK